MQLIVRLVLTVDRAAGAHGPAKPLGELELACYELAKLAQVRALAQKLKAFVSRRPIEGGPMPSSLN